MAMARLKPEQCEEEEEVQLLSMGCCAAMLQGGSKAHGWAVLGDRLVALTSAVGGLPARFSVGHLC